MIIVHSKSNSPKKVFVFYKQLILEEDGRFVTVFCEWMTRFYECDYYRTLVAKNGRKFKYYLPTH